MPLLFYTIADDMTGKRGSKWGNDMQPRAVGRSQTHGLCRGLTGSHYHLLHPQFIHYLSALKKRSFISKII